MCILCWRTVTETHWSEEPLAPEDHDMTTAARAGEGARRRARQHRTQVLNRILSYYGLRLDDWQSQSYVLSDRKGQSRLLQDMGELWPAAQQMAGRCLDPLEAGLLEALEQHQNPRGSTR